MKNSKNAFLELTDIDTFYGKVHILRDLCLKVNEGGIVALLGPNGSGKSTVANTISGFIVPSKGHVRFNGKQIDGLPPEKVVKAGITQVPQAKELFPDLTVKDNLELGAYLRNDKDSIKKDIEMVLEYFPVLREKSRKLAGSLSGGEQQMVNIGRGLMSRPKLFLLDEPSCRLAPIIVKQIFDIIERINRTGITILLIEQNVRMAISIADYVYIIQNGMIAVSDTKDNVEKRDDVRRTYLGW
jgi:branched-chain amino acid transport system ATP-binding protein